MKGKIMIKLVALSFVIEMTGLQKSAIYERVANGTFPRPVKISRASRWSVSEIQSWLEKAVEVRHAK